MAEKLKMVSTTVKLSFTPSDSAIDLFWLLEKKHRQANECLRHELMSDVWGRTRRYRRGKNRCLRCGLPVNISKAKKNPMKAIKIRETKWHKSYSRYAYIKEFWIDMGDKRLSIGVTVFKTEIYTLTLKGVKRVLKNRRDVAEAALMRAYQSHHS